MRDDHGSAPTANLGPNQHIEQPTRGTLRHRAALLRDGLFLKVCAFTLNNVEAGRMHLTLPSGRAAVVGRGGTIQAALRLDDFAAFRNALRRGSLGFAEAYMDGGVKTDDLGQVFRFFLDNRDALAKAWQGQFKVRRSDHRHHLNRANTRTGAKANIAAHYDLGNAFYRPWLDSTMTYSSALYRSADDTLEKAQAHKLDTIVTSLNIKPGMHVLEIGCGWGALALRMAEAGARVTAITISAEQFRLTRERVAERGLSNQIDVQLIDYRDVTGQFDRIVSIEMIEAVGEDNWPAYFHQLHDRLAPGGHAVLQAITIAENRYAAYRAKADFIQRYIFPGGMLLTERALTDQAALVRLDYAPLLRFGPSYARTLADWRIRFNAAWPQLSRLGFDARFYRMWTYYLTYCEIGFEKGAIDVGLYRFERRT